MGLSEIIWNKYIPTIRSHINKRIESQAFNNEEMIYMEIEVFGILIPKYCRLTSITVHSNYVFKSKQTKVIWGIRVFFYKTLQISNKRTYLFDSLKNNWTSWKILQTLCDSFKLESIFCRKAAPVSTLALNLRSMGRTRLLRSSKFNLFYKLIF